MVRAASSAVVDRPGVAAIWRALAAVPDPEIPVISVVDLGIIRGVEWRDKDYVLNAFDTHHRAFQDAGTPNRCDASTINAANESSAEPPRCWTRKVGCRSIAPGRTAIPMGHCGSARRAGYSGDVARHAADLPSDPAEVVVNPEEDVTPETFRAWLEHRQEGDPVDPGVRAADTLAEVRAAGEV